MGRSWLIFPVAWERMTVKLSSTSKVWARLTPARWETEAFLTQ